MAGFDLQISNAAVVDVDAGIVHPGQQIAIRNGRVQSISADRDRVLPAAIDAQGAFVCPGLIDAHVHLFLDGGPEPRVSYLRSDDDTKWKTAVGNAAQALSAGITTVRDCGGPAALVLRFARAVACGDVAGPRIIAAGSPLTRPQGHCHFFGIEVKTPADAERAVDSQARDGAAFVKMMASGGGLTPETRPAEADLPIEIMRAAVRAARSNRLPVSAHCHAVESVVRALDVGVDMIEHASFATIDGPRFDRAIAARMKEQGTVVCPTVISGLRIAQHIRETGSHNGNDRQAIARLEARRDHIGRFCEAGVRLIAGTDCGVGNTPFHSLIDELLEYTRAGMPAWSALRSATSDSARYLCRPELGQVKPGFQADLLLLERNPLEDIEALRQPLAVVQAGKIVCDRRLALAGEVCR